MSKGSGASGVVIRWTGEPTKSTVARYADAAAAVEAHLDAHPIAMEAVKAYTAIDDDLAGYANINRLLFGGKEALDAEYSPEQVARIQSNAARLQAILRAAPKIDATVYRGMKLPAATITELHRNGTFHVKSFFSTSISRSTAENFITSPGKFGSEVPVMLRIKQRSGVALQKVSKLETEREVLLPAGTQLRVVSITKGRQYYKIEAEEI